MWIVERLACEYCPPINDPVDLLNILLKKIITEVQTRLKMYMGSTHRTLLHREVPLRMQLQPITKLNPENTFFFQKEPIQKAL